MTVPTSQVPSAPLYNPPGSGFAPQYQQNTFSSQNAYPQQQYHPPGSYPFEQPSGPPPPYHNPPNQPTHDQTNVYVISHPEIVRLGKYSVRTTCHFCQKQVQHRSKKK